MPKFPIYRVVVDMPSEYQARSVSETKSEKAPVDIPVIGHSEKPSCLFKPVTPGLRAAGRLSGLFAAGDGVARLFLGPRGFVFDNAKSAEANLFRPEDVMPQRSPSKVRFHSMKGPLERGAKTVEPSATVPAPIAINEK